MQRTNVGHVALWKWPFQNGVWPAISLPVRWTHSPGCSTPLQSWAESLWLSGSKPSVGSQWKTTGQKEERGTVCRGGEGGEEEDFKIIKKIKKDWEQKQGEKKQNKKGRENKISDRSPSKQKVSLQHGLEFAQVCRAKLHCFFLRCADPTSTHTEGRHHWVKS